MLTLDFCRDTEIKHDVPWVAGVGSYEDGYLIGLNNLLNIFEGLQPVNGKTVSL